MKLLIASDIHGSAYFCRRLLECYKNESCDSILLLGDILYHGPRNPLPQEYNPMEVCNMLNPLKESITAVRGNCDSEVDQMVLEFPIMSDYALLHIDGIDLYATHGHLYDDVNPMPHKKGSIIACGHIHVPKYICREDFTYINPGSTSIPKENSEGSYIVYENGVFTWKTLDMKPYMTYEVK